jgi:uroporphyrinogen-III synthase
MTTAPSLVVTRPMAQAVAWVDALKAEGLDAVALPLIGIGPSPDPAGVAAAWAALDAAGGAASSPAGGVADETGPVAMFVSPNAVRAFLGARPTRPDGSPDWPAGVLALATGPGTVAALREAGVSEDRIVAPPPGGATFDSEALWAVCRGFPWQGRAAWIVRGNGGRDWFGTKLRQSGAQVTAVAAYERVDVDWTDAERAVAELACAEPDRWIWLFGSSEAIERLQALRPGQDWSRSRAFASHPRIVETARAAGFGCVEEVGVTTQAVAARVLDSSPGA